MIQPPAARALYPQKGHRHLRIPLIGSGGSRVGDGGARFAAGGERPVSAAAADLPTADTRPSLCRHAYGRSHLESSTGIAARDSIAAIGERCAYTAAGGDSRPAAAQRRVDGVGAAAAGQRAHRTAGADVTAWHVLFRTDQRLNGKG